jgi:hypothetical protein
MLERSGNGQRRFIEEQYDAFLADYDPGEYGEAELDEGEKRLTVRKRFKAAAARRGLDLTFQRTSGNVLCFKVVPAAAAETAPEAEAIEPEPAVVLEASPKRRGGRTMAAVAPAR